MVAQTSNQPSTPDTPHPHPGSAPAPTLPFATTPKLFNSNEFLVLLLACDFNLPRVATQLTPAQLLEFTADPKVIERLCSLLEFNNLCLALRHTKDRNLALDTLRDLLASTDDPVEQRPAAASLLTATRPASPAAPAAGDDAEDRPRTPRPLVSPRADLSAEEVIEQLQLACCQSNQKEENSGLATIAAFCDDDATINGEALPTDHPAECIEGLDEAGLVPYQTTVQFWTLSQEISVSKDTAVIPAVFACDHKNTPLKIVFTLKRQNISRHPACWLITKMTTGIYRNTS